MNVYKKLFPIIVEKIPFKLIIAPIKLKRNIHNGIFM